MKVTVKCPCGRKSSHQVVQEGQRAAALRCDAACAQAGRQQQLAGAFGVEDPVHHISSFDRNRSASIPSLAAVPYRTVTTGCVATGVMCMLDAQTQCCSSRSRKVPCSSCGLSLPVACLIILVWSVFACSMLH